jgi:uncharacterized phage infection (PIP) family protein YhgE
VRLAAAAALVALVVVAAGCGGSSSETTTTTAAPASEWANSFCSAFASWRTEFDKISGQFTSLSSFSKENLQSAADDLDQATKQLIDDLKALGAPDTASGEEVKTSVDQLATTLQTQLDSITKTIDEASGVTGILAAAKDVSGSLSTMFDAISSTATTIENADAQGELTDALKSSPDCKDLTK